MDDGELLEIDTRVAEAVMGDERIDPPAICGQRAMRWRSRGELMERPPYYSSSMESAWLVVARMRDHYDCLLKLEQYLMNSDEYEDWSATFRSRCADEEHSSPVGLFTAFPAPVAICLAALDVVAPLPPASTSPSVVDEPSKPEPRSFAECTIPLPGSAANDGIEPFATVIRWQRFPGGFDGEDGG